MTDRLERFLRNEFEDDASRAPDLGSVAGGRLAATVQHGVRRARRRRFAVGVAGALVVLIAVPFAVLGGRGDQRGADPAGPSPVVPSPVVPSPDYSSPEPADPLNPVADGVLHFRGITVDVPKVMLEPGNRRCGSSLVDAAWWEDQFTADRSCRIDVPTDSLNEVTLRAAIPGEPVDATPQRTVMEDGRTAISVGFPERGVVLQVLSPLARRAQNTVASARQVPSAGQIQGCGIKDLGDLSVDRAEGSAADIAPDPAVSGVVCGYREGWLVGSHVLGQNGATELARKLNATELPISEGRRECPTYDIPVEKNGAWYLQLVPPGKAPVEIRATPFRCVIAPVVNDQGVERQLPAPLADYLAGLAVGPAFLGDGVK